MPVPYAGVSKCSQLSSPANDLRHNWDFPRTFMDRRRVVGPHALGPLEATRRAKRPSIPVTP